MYFSLNAETTGSPYFEWIVIGREATVGKFIVDKLQSNCLRYIINAY